MSTEVSSWIWLRIKGVIPKKIGTFRFSWQWDSAHFLCVPWASHIFPFHSLALWASNKFHELQAGKWQVVQIKDNLLMNVPGPTSHTTIYHIRIQSVPSPCPGWEWATRGSTHRLLDQLLRDPISFVVVIGILWCWWDWNPPKTWEKQCRRQISLALIASPKLIKAPHWWHNISSAIAMGGRWW